MNIHKQKHEQTSRGGFKKISSFSSYSLQLVALAEVCSSSPILLRLCLIILMPCFSGADPSYTRSISLPSILELTIFFLQMVLGEPGQRELSQGEIVVVGAGLVHLEEASDSVETE